MGDANVHCREKVRYDSFASAQATLKHIKRRQRQNGKSHDLEIYRCPSCRFWHIGTNAIGRKRRNKPYSRKQLDNLHHSRDP